MKFPWTKENKTKDINKSVAAISKDDRIMIEDRLDNGWLVEEIVADMDITTAQVSRIKDIRNRDAKRNPQVNVQDDDELRIARKQIELMKLEDTKAELEHKQKMRGYEREIKEAELEAELYEDDYEEQQPQNADDMFKMMMMKSLFSGQNAAVSTPQVAPPQVQVSQAQPKDLKEAAEWISQGRLTEEQVVQGALQLGLTEKQGKDFFKQHKKVQP